MKKRSFVCCLLVSSLPLLSDHAEAQTVMSREEQDAICPVISEMAMVATGFRDEGMEEAKAVSAVLREFKMTDKPDKMRSVVSKLAEGVTRLVYATPSLQPDTQAGFHFSACLLNFYQDAGSLTRRLPGLVKAAETCQQENPEMQARIQCILHRFEKG